MLCCALLCCCALAALKKNMHSPTAHRTWAAGRWNAATACNRYLTTWFPEAQGKLIQLQLCLALPCLLCSESSMRNAGARELGSSGAGAPHQ